MFEKLIKLKLKDELLVDDRGIRYLRRVPVRVEEVKFYHEPFVNEIPSSVKEYAKLERKLQNTFPKPNAWLDAGVLKEGIEIVILPDIDLDGTVYREKKDVIYKIRRLEFYFIGQ